MLRLLFLVIWTRQVVHCEKLCDGNNFCAAQDNRYSLADMSYVPHYRRLNASTTRQTNESSVHHNKAFASETVHRSLDNEPLSSKTPVFSTEGQTSSKSFTSKEDAALLKTINATLEVIREFSRSARFAEFVGRVHEEHHDEHHHGNDTDDDDDDGACSNVELTWDEHCYFLTKEPVPGYRAVTACSKLFPSAEFSELQNEGINDLISDYVKKLNSRSEKPIHQRITYVYIKDTHHNTQYRQTKFNPEEESFKKNICDLVGCQCTALRISTGTWHSRICDTRHHALCRRPHVHHDDHEDQEVSTESTVIVHDTEETSSAASSAASWSLIVAAVVTLATGPRLLSAVQR